MKRDARASNDALTPTASTSGAVHIGCFPDSRDSQALANMLPADSRSSPRQLDISQLAAPMLYTPGRDRLTLGQCMLERRL